MRTTPLEGGHSSITFLAFSVNAQENIMPRIRLLIADDHEVVRSGLRKILAQTNCDVVAEASDGREALARALETKPDIAIIDHTLPILDGVEVARQIRAHLPKTEVLMFTMHDNEILVREALKAGVRGFILKGNANENLLEAIESLALHRPFLCPEVSLALVGDFARNPEDMRSAITPRERTIVQLIADGQSNKEIARTLGISVKTVQTHREAAMRKLNLTCSTALVRYAVRNGLVDA